MKTNANLLKITALTLVDIVLNDWGRNSGISGATQSGALGLYCFIEGVNDGAVAAASVSDFALVRPISDIPGETPLGLNGAALAALGDSPLDLVGGLYPLTARDDGVKLGESTFNRFFKLNIFDKHMISSSSRSREGTPFRGVLRRNHFNRIVVECTT